MNNQTFAYAALTLIGLLTVAAIAWIVINLMIQGKSWYARADNLAVSRSRNNSGHTRRKQGRQQRQPAKHRRHRPAGHRLRPGHYGTADVDAPTQPRHPKHGEIDMKRILNPVAGSIVVMTGIAATAAGAWLSIQGEFLTVAVMTALLGAAHCYGINNSHVRKPRLALFLAGAAMTLAALRIAI